MTKSIGIPTAVSPFGTVSPLGSIPTLEAGQRLTRDEFERRYHAMTEVNKAELIEGVVYMPSPVRVEHAEPHMNLIWWMGAYKLHTPGVLGYDNCSVRLDLNNEPQPDGLLLVDPNLGGQARISNDGLVEQAPELTCEVALSSEQFDLNTKLPLYRRTGVKEYLLWRVRRHAIDWFVMRDGSYEKLPQTGDGVIQSETFPGLWLDVQAMVEGDLKQVLAALEKGIASPEHAAFTKLLADRRKQLHQ